MRCALWGIMALMSATLFIVATPIGNLGDITLRALDTLRSVAVIACEDTRHARRLLEHYAIPTPLLTLHQHNEREAAEKLIARLMKNENVALITDAGTPGISDPGARAIEAVRQAGFRVSPLPGPNAAIAALSAAGLTGPFCFIGFLPQKVGARRAALARLNALPAALVFYEAPHRIAECLADLVALFEPEREIVIARELTKVFEQIERMPLAHAPAWLAADDHRRRGEFVLILSAPPPRSGWDAASERILKLLLAELPLKQAVRLASAILDQPKKALYQQALRLQAGG
jgi:16S rRNA (cytidine1402-2'-O)-methyltransferase